jgi:hypothetical protein
MDVLFEPCSSGERIITYVRAHQTIRSELVHIFGAGISCMLESTTNIVVPIVM